VKLRNRQLMRRNCHQGCGQCLLLATKLCHSEGIYRSLRTLSLTLNQAHVIKSVLASIGLGIIAVNKDGTVIFSSAALEELVGVGCASVKAEQWPAHFGIYLIDGLTLCPSEQSPLVRAIAGEEIKDLQVLIRNKINQSNSIETRWCSIDINPLWSEAGDEIAGGVLLIRDISDEKKIV